MFDDVDLELAAGSFHLLVGPNGSGKTTLLRLFATLTPPSSGRVHWGPSGEAPIRDAARARALLGYAGHTPLVYDELTVRENVESLLRVRGLTASDAEARAATWISRFGLTGRANDRADTLSRGLRQRLALAQALAPEPAVLLLDEPASNLDAQGIEALLAELRQLKGRATVVLATHAPDPFRPLADEVLEIHAGTIRARGRPP